jgi:hypothetical protein
MKASCGMLIFPMLFIRFFPSFCFLEQLAFARDVAAVALCGYVLRKAETLSRATILPPIAAWIATW